MRTDNCDLGFFDHRNISYFDDEERRERNIKVVRALNNGAQFSVVFSQPVYDNLLGVIGETDLYYAWVVIAGGYVIPYPVFEEMSGEFFAQIFEEPDRQHALQKFYYKERWASGNSMKRSNFLLGLWEKHKVSIERDGTVPLQIYCKWMDFTYNNGYYHPYTLQTPKGLAFKRYLGSSQSVSGSPDDRMEAKKSGIVLTNTIVGTKSDIQPIYWKHRFEDAPDWYKKCQLNNSLRVEMVYKGLSAKKSLLIADVTINGNSVGEIEVHPIDEINRTSSRVRIVLER